MTPTESPDHTQAPIAPKPSEPAFFALKDLVDSYASEAAEQADAVKHGKVRGAVTGLTTLDNALGGFLRPGLIVLHGAPGAGKSAMAFAWAADAGVPALFLSTEMGGLELLRRHVARKSGYPHQSLLSGQLDVEQEMELVRKAVSSSPHLNIIDATRYIADITFINSAMLVTRRFGTRYCLLVVDSLHSWTAPIASGSGATEYEAINEGISQLRGLADRHDMPVIVLAERHRGAMEKGGLSAARGSGRIEHAGDVVLDLGKDEDAEPGFGPPDATPMLLKIVKNRNGKNAKIPLWFYGSHLQFRERVSS